MKTEGLNERECLEALLSEHIIMNKWGQQHRISDFGSLQMKDKDGAWVGTTSIGLGPYFIKSKFVTALEAVSDPVYRVYRIVWPDGKVSDANNNVQCWGALYAAEQWGCAIEAIEE